MFKDFSTDIHCPACGAHHTQGMVFAGSGDRPNGPRAGDETICTNCCTVLTFTENGGVEVAKNPHPMGVAAAHELRKIKTNEEHKGKTLVEEHREVLRQLASAATYVVIIADNGPGVLSTRFSTPEGELACLALMADLLSRRLREVCGMQVIKEIEVQQRREDE